MGFVAPMPAPAASLRARQLLLRVLPAGLVVAGAFLLAPSWRVGRPDASAGSVLDTNALVGALLVVGGLLFFLPAVLARLKPLARGGGRIELIETRSLGARRSLLLVEVEGHRLLLGSAETGLTRLAELTPVRKPFATSLERALRDEPPTPEQEVSA